MKIWFSKYLTLTLASVYFKFQFHHKFICSDHVGFFLKIREKSLDLKKIWKNPKIKSFKACSQPLYKPSCSLFFIFFIIFFCTIKIKFYFNGQPYTTLKKMAESGLKTYHLISRHCMQVFFLLKFYSWARPSSYFQIFWNYIIDIIQKTQKLRDSFFSVFHELYEHLRSHSRETTCIMSMKIILLKIIWLK